MFKKAVFLVLAMWIVFLTNFAFAQTVEILSKAEFEIKTKKTDGTLEVKRVPADKANVGPGDVIIFSNICQNKGEKPAENVVITNPIPTHTVYIDGSAEGLGARIEFSVDGGKTYKRAEELQVIGKDGKLRKAIPEDYTHVRWVLINPIPPGKSIIVSFKAKIK